MFYNGVGQNVSNKGSYGQQKLSKWISNPSTLHANVMYTKFCGLVCIEHQT